MSVEIREVSSKQELRKFIHLPAKIHKHHSTWLPNIYMDEWNFFNAQKNHAFSYSDTLLLLAWKEGELVGRIMGIINRRYNEQHGEYHGRWGYLECYEDQEVAHALLSAVEEWAVKKGMQKIVGPYGFSDKDPQGLLIEGFEHPPMIASACNFPYLVNLVEQEGYTKEIDCLVYKFYLTDKLPEIYERISNRISSSNGYKVISFRKTAELKPFIIPILSLMNETYSHLYGFVPLEKTEMEDFAKRYLSIVDPRFVKVVEAGNRPVAFMIAVPHMTRGIQRSKGYLLPFGIFHILRAAKKTHQLDLMLGAVHPDFQGRGIEVLMAIKLFESMMESHFNTIEIHLMLETNTRMLSEMKHVDARLHKRFRVFQKTLD